MPPPDSMTQRRRLEPPKFDVREYSLSSERRRGQALYRREDVERKMMAEQRAIYRDRERVLAEAQALKEEDELQEAREAESSQLSVVLEDVQVELEQCERDVAQMHGGSGTSADFSAAWRGEVCTCPGAAEQREPAHCPRERSGVFFTGRWRCQG